MKLIIDIPKAAYIASREVSNIKGENGLDDVLIDAVANGTVLSECKVEDCVSREAVDDILCLYSDNNGLMDARSAVTLVRELPPVYPKSGKWIIKNDKINCSNCKKSSWSRSFIHTVKNFNYCPNCGANMREVEE